MPPVGLPATEPSNASARRPLRVTVLRGGPSAEREVSLASGAAVAAALRRRGHEVFESDINADDLRGLNPRADVVFPALHGRFGEDGTLQRILEERRIAFVGSGAAASATAMDKVATKRVALITGIPTPRFEVVPTGVPAPATSLPLPVIVKPVAEGSSVATSIVGTLDEFGPAIERVHAAGCGAALVEEFIAGDELTVGVLDDRTLPPICIRPRAGFYDYHAKYQANDTEYLFDAGHPPKLLAEAGRMSRLIFDRLGCRHLGRVDWMVDRVGGLWFLEVNTLPGFTDHSLLPKAAAHAGISFEELVERLVFAALEGRE